VAPFSVWGGGHRGHSGRSASVDWGRLPPRPADSIARLRPNVPGRRPSLRRFYAVRRRATHPIENPRLVSDWGPWARANLGQIRTGCAPFIGQSVQVGVDPNLLRANTLAFTPGVQFLVRPNVKLGFEYQVRQTRQEDRALGELHLSF
jgi:hypothetical protein